MFIGTEKAHFDDVYCLIPMFNEAQVIGNVVKELGNVFSNIVCVDDGSSDDSSSVAKNAGAKVLRHSLNIGQGGSLVTGFRYLSNQVNCKFVITFDADGQHKYYDAVSLARCIKESELDIVFGTRFFPESNSNVPKFKRFILKGIAFSERKRLRIELTDTHNGLRVLRSSILPYFFSIAFGMSHATEIVKIVAKSDLKFSELPVTIVYTDYSIKKGQSLLNGINIISDLLLKSK